MAGSIEKRIEALEQKANSRGARWIVIEVDGNLPDDDAAIDALLAPLSVGRQDTVAVIKKFVVVEGLPRIASVTSL
jgi:hypothetical protein